MTPEELKQWATYRRYMLGGPYANWGVNTNNEYELDNQEKYGYGTDLIYTQNLVAPGNALLLAKLTVGTTDAPKNNTLDFLIDTGSSWTWAMSCNKNEEPYWKLNNCPYFDET